MHLAHLCLNFLIPSKNRRPFPGPLRTHLLPLWRLHCPHTVYHEDGTSVLGTAISQKEPYQENIGDEEGCQAHIQSQQSLQLVNCGQGRILQEQNTISQFSSTLSSYFLE